MKVLISGVNGYVGSVLARDLLHAGYSVVGVDNLSGGGSAILSFLGMPNFKFIKADLRESDWMKDALSDVDGVIHLAAIVGDPACAQNPELAKSTNWDGACNLFNAAQASSRVSRFIFSSTCSNYGRSEDIALLTEESALKPVSLYAELKVKFEQFLLSQKLRAGLAVTPLRFATVYGISPRMRFDLTVNEFTREAYLKRKLVVFGEQFWRPYCHVRDIARACQLVLKAEASLVQGQVFNVGSSTENYQKKMIVDCIKKQFADFDVEYVSRAEDPRDYRVSFEKIASSLSFVPSMTISSGIAEILEGLSNQAFGDPYSAAYSNI